LSLVDLNALLFAGQQKNDDDAAAPALSRRWIAGVCYALQHAVGGPLVLVLQAFFGGAGRQAPGGAAARRKNKKKGAAAAASNGPVGDAAQAAVVEARTTFDKLRTTLTDAKAALEHSLTQQESSRVPPPASALLPPDVATTIRNDLRSALSTGQILAIDRILEIVSAKRTALGS